MDLENNLQVRIFRNGHPVTRCQANYVGLLGMQINAGPLKYPKGTHLEVELRLTEQNDERQCKLPAVVTNHSSDGMGLTFLNHDMQTNSTLLEIILTQDTYASTAE